jgi:NAD(P)-dependent dehydrogenase (short-subunit alcohol dehydrogenase family)
MSHVLVTGAATGIGRATARALLEENMEEEKEQ